MESWKWTKHHWSHFRHRTRSRAELWWTRVALSSLGYTNSSMRVVRLILTKWMNTRASSPESLFSSISSEKTLGRRTRIRETDPNGQETPSTNWWFDSAAHLLISLKDSSSKNPCKDHADPETQSTEIALNRSFKVKDETAEGQRKYRPSVPRGFGWTRHWTNHQMNVDQIPPHKNHPERSGKHLKASDARIRSTTRSLQHKLNLIRKQL